MAFPTLRKRAIDDASTSRSQHIYEVAMPSAATTTISRNPHRRCGRLSPILFFSVDLSRAAFMRARLSTFRTHAVVAAKL
jgi:hypothetical protein